MLGVLLLSLFAWRASVRHAEGYTGVWYVDPEFPEMEGEAALPLWQIGPGQVLYPWPGSPAEEAGILTGDRVVAINGVPIGDSSRIAQLDDSLHRGDVVSYELVRGGQEVGLSIELRSPFSVASVLIGTGSSLASSLTFLLVGLFVWQRSASRTARVFLLFCGAGAAFFLTAAHLEFDQEWLRGVRPGMTTDVDLIAFAYIPLMGGFGVLIVSLLLHLTLLFPRHRPVLKRHPLLPHWIHGFAFLPWLPILIFPLTGSAIDGQPWRTVSTMALGIGLVWLLYRAFAVFGRERFAGLADRPWTLLSLYSLVPAFVVLLPGRWTSIAGGALLVLVSLGSIFVVMLVYPLLTSILLLRSYRDSGVEERNQIRWPVWGTSLGLGVATVVTAYSSFAVLMATPSQGTLNLVLREASKLGYVLIPISFAFAILKYRLLEIELVIKRTLVYGGLTGAVVVVYMVLASVLGTLLVSWAGFQSQAVVVISTLAVAGLLLPLRNGLQRGVERRLFRVDRDRGKLLAAFRERTLDSGSLAEVLGAGVELVQMALRCRSVAVWSATATPTGAGGGLELGAKLGVPDTLLRVPALSLDSAVLQGPDRLIELEAGSLPVQVAEGYGASNPVLAAVSRLRTEPVVLLTIGERLGRQRYDQADRSFLAQVADQLAFSVAALATPRDAEAEQAYQMQRNLLPSEIPQFPGFEIQALWLPARAVSGDYYDVLDLSGSERGVPAAREGTKEPRFGFCIGDVSGKGTPAALLMSSLQGLIKITAPLEPSTRAVCERARSVICQNLTGGRFISFFYAVLAERGSLTYTNCGHNPPILCRESGECERLETGGPAFARLMSNQPLTEGHAQLRSGDRLVLFTDGVTEVRDEREEELGDSRLEELVKTHRRQSADHLRTTLADAARSHGGGHLQDDLTLLVIAVT